MLLDISAVKYKLGFSKSLIMSSLVDAGEKKMKDSCADSVGAPEVCMSVCLSLSFCGDINVFTQPHCGDSLLGTKTSPCNVKN